METPDLILNLYNQILAGASTESIHQAQKQLLLLESSPAFLPNNSAILYEPKVPLPTKKFAALYLSKYSKRVLKEKSMGKCEGIIKEYLSVVGSPLVDMEVKVLFVGSLEVLLNFEGNRALRVEFNRQFVQLACEAVEKEDGQVDFGLIVLSGLAVMGRDSYSEEIKEVIKASVCPLINLTARLLKRAGEERTENREVFLTIWRVVKEYSSLLKLFFKRMALLDVEGMRVLYLPELEALFSLVLPLNYPDNQLASPLYHSLPGEEQASRLINRSKANFIIALSNAVRLISTFTKHPSLLETNPLYLRTPHYLSFLVAATAALLAPAPYYQLPTRLMLLETLGEVMQFFIGALRLNHFYALFAEKKGELLDHLVIPCLALTPRDVENFYEDEEEFVHATLQAMGAERLVFNCSSAGGEEPEEEVRQFETLRSLAAELLIALCRFQDGTLSHVVDSALAVLGGQAAGEKSLMLLVVCILHREFERRGDLKARVSGAIVGMAEGCALPVAGGARKMEDLEYAYLLFALSKVFFFALEEATEVVGKAYKLGVAVVQSPSASEVHKFFVFELFNHLARIDEAASYADDILALYNHLLQTAEHLSFPLLDAYYTLVKYNPEEFKKSPAKLLEGIRLLCGHIAREAGKAAPTLILLNKCWNIIREVGENGDFIPALIEPIEKCVLPLLAFIDGERKLHFEEDILMLLTSFIEKSRTVTPAQQAMFDIIPKVFYSQYHCRFGQAFHTVQLFIYYGAPLLSAQPASLAAIVDMALASLTAPDHSRKSLAENESCQGVLVLQGLVLKCGHALTRDLWTTVVKAVLRRLQETQVRLPLLSSNLYALLSLALVHSHRFFSGEENEIVLSKVLSEMRVFNRVKYSPKVMIAGLTELLLLSECEFVGRRFTQVLDVVVTMLEITSVRRENYFEEEEDEEKEYGNSLLMVKNDIKDLDEFTYFRQQVAKLKVTNLPLLQRSVNDLPKAKRDFLTHILRVERVANEPRQIYRIKR